MQRRAAGAPPETGSSLQPRAAAAPAPERAFSLPQLSSPAQREQPKRSLLPPFRQLPLRGAAPPIAVCSSSLLRSSSPAQRELPHLQQPRPVVPLPIKQPRAAGGPTETGSSLQPRAAAAPPPPPPPERVFSLPQLSSPAQPSPPPRMMRRPQIKVLISASNEREWDSYHILGYTRFAVLHVNSIMRLVACTVTSSKTLVAARAKIRSATLLLSIPRSDAQHT